MQRQAADRITSTVSVVLLNMGTMFSDLLCSAFAKDGAVRILGCATDAENLAIVLDRCVPEIALIGVQGLARETSAIPFLQQLASRAPSVRSIVIAPQMDREDVISLFHEGVRGLICAGATDVSMLTKCVACVAKGQIWASASQMDSLVQSLSSPRSFAVTNVLGDTLLSKREEQVLHLLADGMSNRELAATLKLSEHTVKNHLFRIFDKLGVSNRMEAVLYLISQKEQRRLAVLPRSNSITEGSGGIEGLRDARLN